MTNIDNVVTVLKEQNLRRIPVTNLSSFQGLNSFKKLRAIIPAVTCLIIVSFFIIGGCNNSSSNQVDARTIGQIDGVIVPALKQVLTLQEWQEGDPDGHLYLNGSRVATLSDAEKQAINDSYNMGYIVGLVNTEIDDILELHEVLGMDPIFADNGTLDLLAITREFNVSGVRYFIMRPYQSEDDTPMPDDLNIDRVIALGEFAPTASSVSSASLQLRESGSFDFTEIADSTAIHQYTAAAPVCDPNIAPCAEYPPDMQLVLQGSIQVWSVHSFSSMPPSDLYYFRAGYSVTPKSLQGTLGEVCNKACDLYVPDTCYGSVTGFEGAGSYIFNNFQDAYAAPEIIVIKAAPPTTTGEITTTNSLDHTISEDVSYSQEEGASVGVSDSATVSHSTSFSTPAVTTTLDIASDAQKNNARWLWKVVGTADAIATLSPSFQWIWAAGDATRTPGYLNVQQSVKYTYYPYSCYPWVGTSAFAILNTNVPLPPLPTPCTVNSDCGVGQVCATDFPMSICAAQACDESMVCPASFACMNEICQPTN
jgi:hypothetical protein